jgi:hypothetical protein
LQALIWPEQTERFDRLSQAIEIARDQPVEVTRGDLTTDLADVAATAPRSATLVVFHSAVLAYLDDSQRARFRAEIAQLTTDRPTVWLSNEGPGICVEVAIPPGPVPFVLARGETPLAFTGPHGGWVQWLAD